MLYLLLVFLLPALSYQDPPHVGRYCASFRVNYEFYCHGIWTDSKFMDILKSHSLSSVMKFCKKFEGICVHRNGKNKENLAPVRRVSEQDIRKKMKKMSYEQISSRLSQLIPCTPECDQREYSHCTRDCKCDYDYKFWLRYCDPAATKKLEITCSIMFQRCPQYIQYKEEDSSDSVERAHMQDSVDVDAERRYWYHRLG
ncbi:unnamed protein product [Auanema sp. JU1783]|nr:unnamed protein product [Auanema sp. JU1783]